MVTVANFILILMTIFQVNLAGFANFFLTTTGVWKIMLFGKKMTADFYRTCLTLTEQKSSKSIDLN